VQHIFSPLKSNQYWAFYLRHRRYRRLPPSGGKQGKLNFVTNKKLTFSWNLRLIEWKMKKVVFLQNMIICFLVRPFMTGNKGGVSILTPPLPPPPRTNRLAKYLGLDRVNESSPTHKNKCYKIKEILWKELRPTYANK
jgi:hypothetical protein